MHARVFTFQIKQPEMIDALYQMMQNELLTVSQTFSGFTDALHLANRQAGKLVTITIWDTEAQARSFVPSEEQLRQWASFDEFFTAQPTDEILEMLI